MKSRLGVRIIPAWLWPVALLLLLPAVGRAQTAAHLRFEIQGATDAERQLERDAREGLSQKLALVPAERVDAILKADKTLASCEQPACLARFAEQTGARFTVRGTIAYDGSDYSIELRADDAAAARALAPEQVKCVLCGWAELREKVAAAGRALGTRAAAEPAIEKKLPPSSSSHRGPVIHQGKWIAGAIGAGLIATGAVMLIYDGHCAFSPPQATTAGCPRSYDSALEGGVFLGAGAAFVATSITFFALDRRPRVVPSLAPTNGGATLTLTVRY